MAKPNLVTRFHLLVAAAQVPFTLTALVRVPKDAQLAMHWDEHGAVDWSWPAPWAFLIMPAIAVVLLAIAGGVSARADKHRLEMVRHLLEPALTYLLIILMFLQIGLMLIGLETDIDLIRVVVPAVGFALFLLGVLLREAERNTYAGLRLPWAIKDDKVWRRTHRVAGWATLAMGVALALLTWLTPYPGTLMVALVPALALPVILARLVSLGR